MLPPEFDRRYPMIVSGDGVWVQDAAGAFVIRASIDLRSQRFRRSGAPRIEQVDDGRDRPAIASHAEHVMPESAGGYSRGLHTCLLQVPVDFGQRLNRQARQLLGIHFDSAIGCRIELIRDLSAKSFLLATGGVEQ